MTNSTRVSCTFPPPITMAHNPETTRTKNESKLSNHEEKSEDHYKHMLELEIEMYERDLEITNTELMSREEDLEGWWNRVEKTQLDLDAKYGIAKKGLILDLYFKLSSREPQLTCIEEGDETRASTEDEEAEIYDDRSEVKCLITSDALMKVRAELLEEIRALNEHWHSTRNTFVALAALPEAVRGQRGLKSRPEFYPSSLSRLRDGELLQSKIAAHPKRITMQAFVNQTPRFNSSHQAKTMCDQQREISKGRILRATSSISPRTTSNIVLRPKLAGGTSAVSQSPSTPDTSASIGDISPRLKGGRSRCHSMDLGRSIVVRQTSAPATLPIFPRDLVATTSPKGTSVASSRSSFGLPCGEATPPTPRVCLVRPNSPRSPPAHVALAPQEICLSPDPALSPRVLNRLQQRLSASLPLGSQSPRISTRRLRLSNQCWQGPLVDQGPDVFCTLGVVAHSPRRNSPLPHHFSSISSSPFALGNDPSGNGYPSHGYPTQASRAI